MPDDEIPPAPRRSPLTVGLATVRAFLADRGTDLAAALTFYATLAVAPAAAALVSVVGLVERPDAVVEEILGVLREVATPEVVETVASLLGNLTAAEGVGWAFLVGLVVALWSASAWVTAFGRAMNSVHGVEEGRPVWVLRPLMWVLTLVLVVVAALVLVLSLVSADLARTLGGPIGLSDQLVTVFGWLRWPVVVVALVVLVSLLYHWTPNVRPARFRILSPGAAVAIAVIGVASWGFGVYVSNFASYDRTYGALASIVVVLVWLWICSMILVLGAELDVELERGRRLRSGLPVERPYLEVRSTVGLERRAQARARAAEKEARRIATARAEHALAVRDAKQAAASATSSDDGVRTPDDRLGTTDARVRTPDGTAAPASDRAAASDGASAPASDGASSPGRGTDHGVGTPGVDDDARTRLED